MKVLKSKKALIFLISVSSVVIAGTIKDIHSRAVKLEVSEAVEKVIIPVERNLASTKSKVAQLFLPLNSSNSEKINKIWEITRIIDNKEVIVFDKLSNVDDSKKSIKVPMELMNDGLVRVNKDNDQIYKVSLLSTFGTIVLFKKLGNGFEIIEAKLVPTKRGASTLSINGNIELVLERALNQSKSNKVLEGNEISGQVTVSKTSLSGLYVELRNPNGETQNIEIDYAELMDGGAFKADVMGEEVSGVIFNNGKDGFRVSFVTGPIAGSMLNFVTKNQLEKIEQAEYDSKSETAENNLSIEEVEIASQQISEDRQTVAKNPENYEPVKVLSADEIRQTAEEKGFNF